MPGVATGTLLDAPLGLSLFFGFDDSSARPSEEVPSRAIPLERGPLQVGALQIGLARAVFATGRSQPCTPRSGVTCPQGARVADPRRSCEHVELVVRCRPRFPRVRPKSYFLGTTRWMTGRACRPVHRSGSLVARLSRSSLPCDLQRSGGPRAARIRTRRNGFSSVVAPTGAFRDPLPGHRVDGHSPGAFWTGSSGPTSSSPELGDGLQGRRSQTVG